MANLTLFDMREFGTCIEKNVFDETKYLEQVQKVITLIPDEKVELMQGVKWGHYGTLYTPAYWKIKYHTSTFSTDNVPHNLCDTLIDEIVFCLLGGYGMKSEIGDAAFKRLKKNGSLRPNVPFEELYYFLSQPFYLNNKSVHYRFYNQKSNYLYRFFQKDDIDNIPADNDIELRDWLLGIDGVGYKTASWITRNWLQSNNVAILDVHILRAGMLMGIFDRSCNPSADYLELENKYINFCNAINVPPADLDAIIWYDMKNNSKLAIDILNS